MGNGGADWTASIPGSGDGPEAETDLLSLLARSYSVAGNLHSVAEAVIEHATDHPTQNERTATIPVLAALTRKPVTVARLRRGEDPFGADRKAMMLVLKVMVGPWHPRQSSAEFVDDIINEVRSALLRVTGHIDE
jgi:hypothetical protein